MAKVALLIGVGNYEHPDDLKPLVSAPKDVAAMQRILLNAQMGEFSEVIPLIDPDPMQMQEAIETLYRDRAKDDLVLLFFSGHGIKDDSGKLYFSTRVTRKTPRGELVKSSAVPARFVQEIMGNSRSRRQVMILDCCFSGAFDPSLNAKDDGSLDIRGQLGAEGRVVLTSSSSTEYSFEQQGSDLSIYTRFLVEGIETGAADQDSDGKVSVEELHKYATKKVQEIAPKMNPKIIVLKDEGFGVVFAKAQITDPKLKYRKEAERYSMRGEISPAGRTLLNTLRVRLGLSLEKTQEIEDQVLQPFRERLKHLEDYRSAFVAEVGHQYPLTQETLNELKDLQEILGLRKKDVMQLEQEVTSQVVSGSEVYKQKLQRYEQEFTRAIQVEFPLSQPVCQGLNKFQSELGLTDEDVEQIKQPIIERRTSEYQQRQLEQQKQQDVEQQQQEAERLQIGQQLEQEYQQNQQQPIPLQHEPVRSSSSNKLLMTGACLSAIVISGGLFYFNSPRPQPQPIVKEELSTGSLTPVASPPSITPSTPEFPISPPAEDPSPAPRVTPSPDQSLAPRVSQSSTPEFPISPPAKESSPAPRVTPSPDQSSAPRVSQSEIERSHSSNIGNSQSRPATIFFCGQIDGVPATITSHPRLGEVPFILWVSSDYFGDPSYTPQKRCEEVSRRFQTNHEAGTLKYIFAGRATTYPALCASTTTEIMQCTNENVLMILRASDDAVAIIRQIGEINTANTFNPIRL